MARPKKYNIDTKQVEKLASLGCSPDLLEKSYSEFLIKGRATQRIRLRQLQWKSAERGNVTMQIFLGKNMLGQQDRLEENQIEEPLVWTND